VEPAVTALATFAWVLGVAVVAPAVFGRGVLLAAVGGGIAPAVAWGHGYLLGQCLLAPVTLLQARLDWPVHGAIAPLVAAAVGFALARRAARAVASPGWRGRSAWRSRCSSSAASRRLPTRSGSATKP
jgi:hypothetical protein